jgi:hypothetical protein
MTQPSSIAKEFSSGHGERRIRAMVADGDVFLPKTFPESELEGVMGLGDDKSALVLRSGAAIPVTLPYEELEQKIYERDFRTDGPVLDLRGVTGEAAKPKAPANTNKAPAPGDKMPDGTVFAGSSPDTNKPMYVTPADASLTMKFNEAQEYAAKLDAHGHKDWHVPTKAELNVLFNNRAAIGGFDISGSNPAGWYWSSTQNDRWDAWGQRFSDGAQTYDTKHSHSSVRCVR